MNTSQFINDKFNFKIKHYLTGIVNQFVGLNIISSYSDGARNYD